MHGIPFASFVHCIAFYVSMLVELTRASVVTVAVARVLNKEQSCDVDLYFISLLPQIAD